MVGDFQIHAFAEFACYGPVEVLLHVAVGDRWSFGQPVSACHDFPLEVGRRKDGIDDSEPLGLFRADALGEVVELFGFAAAYQPGEKPGPAVVSGERDPGEGRGQPGRSHAPPGPPGATAVRSAHPNNRRRAPAGAFTIRAYVSRLAVPAAVSVAGGRC